MGGGHNGLACAALSAKAGLSVALFERSPILGGTAVSEPMWNGYTVSSASYVCTLLDPWLISELDLEGRGYHAYRKDPATFNVLRDGSSMLLGSNDDTNAAEIAAFNPRDVAGFIELDRVTRRLGSELFETFSDDEPRFENLPAESQGLLRGSVAEFIERYVETPVLQAAIATDGTIGTYLGPRDAGTMYVLAHHFAGRALGVQGAWGYVRGGMGSISKALASAAQSYGAHLFADAPVEKITVRDGRVAGVVLRDGRTIRAKVVASNAHPQTTYADLVGTELLDDATRARLKSWRTIGPSMKVNLAIGELPDFTARPGTTPRSHHRATIHVAPSMDYIQQAYEDTKSGSVSREPMLECFLQTPTDPTLVPPGKHILSIFAQYYPYDVCRTWTKEDGEREADRMVALLAEFAPNLPGAIEARQIFTPADLEARFGLVGGHIFHGELLPGQIYEDRFPTRSSIDGLYLCGSGAHPGGCVSGFPGKRAANAIVKDLKATFRQAQGDTVKR
ncbi:MAG: NAD(P)/FAD-dependent oxidoreductase [Candidatus Eremiobacteraeota bacterium]|nr:NAD(P)/FAD-dependent oxidoreductase [Candidatus Eremiobacteraeota bacterium]